MKDKELRSRAEELAAKLTLDEKISMIHGAELFRTGGLRAHCRHLHRPARLHSCVYGAGLRRCIPPDEADSRALSGHAAGTASALRRAYRIRHGIFRRVGGVVLHAGGLLQHRADDRGTVFRHGTRADLLGILQRSVHAAGASADLPCGVGGEQDSVYCEEELIQKSRWNA